MLLPQDPHAAAPSSALKLSAPHRAHPVPLRPRSHTHAPAVVAPGSEVRPAGHAVTRPTKMARLGTTVTLAEALRTVSAVNTQATTITPRITHYTPRLNTHMTDRP